MFPNIWFEPIVLFLNSDSLSIEENKINYFDNINSMIDYINKYDRYNKDVNINKLLKNIVCYDRIKSLFNNTSCIIDEKSLVFKTDKKIITKKDISVIKVEHYLNYDYLYVYLLNGEHYRFINKLAKLRYISNDKLYEVSINKINNIVIGNIFYK